MTLGQKVRYRRTALRLSQYELSEMTGISQPYLSQLERGDFNPTAPIISALAKALKCSSDWLLNSECKKAI